MGRRLRIGIAAGCLVAVGAAVLVLWSGGGEHATASRPESERGADTDASRHAAPLDATARATLRAPASPADDPSAAAAGTASPDRVLVAGCVVDRGGRPIAGARLAPYVDDHARATLGRSDEAGRFEIDVTEALRDARGGDGDVHPAGPALDLGRADFVLLVEAHGFAADTFPLPDLRPGVNDAGALVLGPAAVLRGRVVDPAGTPVAAADVFTLHDAVSFATTSGALGEFTLDILWPGFVHVAARKEGFAFEPSGGIRLWLSPDEPSEGVVLVLHPTHDLAGRVRDVAGTPVANARVRVWTHEEAPPAVERAMDFDRGEHAPAKVAARLGTATTDADGRFVARVLPVAGPMFVTVSSQRHADARVTIPDLTRDVEIVLEPLPVLDLHARDARSHAPVDVAWIAVRGTRTPAPERPDLRARPQDLDAKFQRVFFRGDGGKLRVAPGRYRVPFAASLDPVEPGHWIVVEARSPDHAPWRSEPIALDGAAEPQVAAWLEPLRVLEVTVHDAAGAPVQGATVRLLAAGDPQVLPLAAVHGVGVPRPGRLAANVECRTARDGSCRFPLGPELAAGTMRIVEAESPRFAPAFAEVVVAPAGATSAEVTLSAGGSIEGVVTGIDGKPASGEFAIAHDAAGHVRAGRSGAGGRYRIGPLPAGAFVVRPGDGGRSLVHVASGIPHRAPPDLSRFDVVVEAGRATRHDVDLSRPPGLCVLGTVRIDGTTSFGLLVKARREEGPPHARHGLHGRVDEHETRPDATGVFRFVDLAPGTWRVFVHGAHGPRASAVVQVSLERGAIAHLEGTARSVAGIAHDGRTGRPATAEIVLAPPGAEGTADDRRYVTNSFGHFEFLNLAPAVYAIAAFTAEGRRPLAAQPELVDLRDGDVPWLELAIDGDTNATVSAPPGFFAQTAYVAWTVRLLDGAATSEPVTLRAPGDVATFADLAPGRHRLEVVATPAPEATTSPLRLVVQVHVVPWAANDLTPFVHVALQDAGVLAE